MKNNILDSQKLEEFRKKLKLQPFRIKQIYHEIFKQSQIDFENITNLSKELRTQLKEEFDILPFSLDKMLDNDDTTKFSFKTYDDKIIETVIMYHHHDQSWKKRKLNRITLCVSSQIGCPIWCLFCITGKLGFSRNLDYIEIVGQLLFANNFIKNKLGKKEDWTNWQVRNVVFMWMWEPLLNYDNVMKSVKTMLDQNWFSLSKRHITISTCGIIPKIQQLIDDGITVKLAISLHSPDQSLREKLMPVCKNYKIDELMKMIDKYIYATDNRIFWEYIMIRWITDKIELAHWLGNLLRWRLAHVNLISYNENPAIDFKESENTTIAEFKKIVESYWVTVTNRQSMGRDKKWACWQLGYESLLIPEDEDL